VIDVAFTPAELRPARLAVVVDVLRATSTATQALAAGYGRVVFAGTVARALSLRAPGRVLAGERRCIAPAGFDQGNSPAEAADVRGAELVLATTNGAPATLAAAAHAPTVLLGCLLNLDALIAAVWDRGDAGAGDIQLVCSGTDGAPALEDTYVAGRISSALPGPKTDAALVAEAVARAFRSPADALGAGADARVLRANGLAGDIEHCAATSTLDCVPLVLDARDGVAITADANVLA
jgi:2-phosphosulfolactate phosphatase